MPITASQVKELREQTGLGMMDCKKALGETEGNMAKAIEYLRKKGAAVAQKRMGREAKEGKVVLTHTGAAVVAVDINCETDFVAASDDFKNFSHQVISIASKEMPADVDTLSKMTVEGKTIDELKTDIMGKLGEKITIRRLVVEKLGPQDFAETYSHMGGKIGVILKLSADNPIEPSSEISTLAKDLAMQVAACNPLSIDREGISQDILEKEKEIYREITIKEGKPAQIVDRIVEGRLKKFFQENCLQEQIFIKDTKMTVESLINQKAKPLKLNNLRISAFHRLQLGQ
ncbi:translation elongation factor Ts [Fibrobacterota bacterium]